MTSSHSGSPDQSTPGGPTRSSGASRRRPARILRDHWQVIAALVLLVVGSAGLMLTDYPKGDDCSLDGAHPIPQRLMSDLESASKESGFPVRVLAAQIQAESGWRADAHSHAGAMGIAQFTQDTWDVWGKGDPMNEHDAIAAQGRYMKFLREEVHDAAKGDEDTITRYALAGYNAGPNAVKKHKGVPDYPETTNYVDKIMHLASDEYTKKCAVE